MIEIVPSRPEHFAMFHVEHPRKSVRALSGVRDGKVVGIGGYYVSGSRRVAFLKMGEKDFGASRAMLRAWKRLFSGGVPVVALCDATIEGADKLLRHLGFEPVSDGVWQWHG